MKIQWRMFEEIRSTNIVFSIFFSLDTRARNQRERAYEKRCQQELDRVSFVLPCAAGRELSRTKHSHRFPCRRRFTKWCSRRKLASKSWTGAQRICQISNWHRTASRLRMRTRVRPSWNETGEEETTHEEESSGFIFTRTIFFLYVFYDFYLFFLFLFFLLYLVFYNFLFFPLRFCLLWRRRKWDHETNGHLRGAVHHGQGRKVTRGQPKESTDEPKGPVVTKQDWHDAVHSERKVIAQQDQRYEHGPQQHRNDQKLRSRLKKGRKNKRGKILKIDPEYQAITPQLKSVFVLIKHEVRYVPRWRIQE